MVGAVGSCSLAGSGCVLRGEGLLLGGENKAGVAEGEIPRG